jgi:hypothetical protein
MRIKQPDQAVVYGIIDNNYIPTRKVLTYFIKKGKFKSASQKAAD